MCIYLYAVLSGDGTLQSVRGGGFLCKEQGVFSLCNAEYRFCEMFPAHNSLYTSSTAACPAGDSV